jgi:8-oxo-dGTP pyrophosphatase MutT (NUDIX family)
MPDPSSSADRALRALADTMGDGRQRVDANLSDPDIPVAATVVLLREGRGGLEVLLIERPDRGSFAGAWVFPGGKLDPSDEGPADEGVAPEEADARRAAVRETREETGLEVAASALVTLSCWDPPPGLPLRIRTWFFLGEAPAGDLVLEPGEAVAAEWIRPAEALQRQARGELTLYPPTWVTLHGLSNAHYVESALAAARMGKTQVFETQVRGGPTGPVFYWREDAEYDGDRPDAASGPRHRLEVGASPWVYTRRD